MNDATEVVKNFIRALIAQGVLTPPVIFNGETIDLGGAPTPVPGDGYLASGWKFNAGSPINAPRSRGVDALRQELLDAGHPLVARLLPEYHVVRFWAPDPSKAKSFGVQDLTRFAFPEGFDLPTGVTNDHVTQAIDNIHELWNRQFTLEMVGFKSANLYRGEPGRVGYPSFAQKIGELTSADAGRFAISLADAYANMVPPNLLLDATKFERKYKFDVNGTPTGLFDKVVVGEALPGHKVYDVWFDTDNDANITRHWRSFAVACGALTS